MFRRLSSLQIGVDLAITAGYLFLTLPFTIGLTSVVAVYPEVTTAGMWVYPIVFAGAVALRRLSPALALALAWIAALVQMAAGIPPTLADVAVFAVLYTAAAYGSRLVFWLGFVSTFVGAIVIAAYLSLTLGLDASAAPRALLVLAASLFGLLLAWTVGALVRTALRASANRVAAEEAEAETAAEHERGQIARDMHDVVAHSLAVVIAQADGARYAAGSDPDAATRALETISSTARAALGDVRLLLTQLRHRQGDGPQPTLADLDALYAQVRAAGVRLIVDVDPAPPAEPPTGVQLAVYRILQEALTNALRHGAGAPVEVRLAWHAERVELSVRNRAPAAVAASTSGHGLVGMSERAQLVGGHLRAGRAGGDFLVSATLPISPTQEDL